jgi:hypothetical protein
LLILAVSGLNAPIAIGTGFAFTSGTCAYAYYSVGGSLGITMMGLAFLNPKKSIRFI